MAKKQVQQRSTQKQARGAKQPGGKKKDDRAVTPEVTQALSYQPGISPGAVDVTGIVPEDVSIDPDILEGHPGYEESGGSGIGPTDLARRATRAPIDESKKSRTS